MMLIENLYDLLNQVDKLKSGSFNGLGLIVYSDLSKLPISPLKKYNDEISLPIETKDSIVKFLISSSNNQSKYHDGFHLLNFKLELTHVAQYVSPPIERNVDLNFEFGSRFRTAFYSSLIPSVIATGILSQNYPPTIFKNGIKIF